MKIELQRRRRRRRWFAAFCLTLAVLATWFVAGSPSDVVDPNTTTRRMGRKAPDGEAIAQAFVAESGQSKASIAIDSGACGAIGTAARPVDVVKTGEYQVVPMQSSRDRVLEALQAWPKPISRATKLLSQMLGKSAGDKRTLTASNPPSCTGNDCPTDPMLAERAVARDALVRLAMTTSDPKVYAMAWRACKPHAAVGVCALVSAHQWAQIDVYNGTPWLHILDQAEASGDRAAVEYALSRLAGAKHGNSGSIDAVNEIFAAAGEDPASTLGGFELVIAVLGFEATVGLPRYQTLVHACTSPALAAPQRRQVCSSIAEYLVDRSDSLADRSVGISIGRQAGWSEYRVDRLKGEADYFFTFARGEPKPTQSVCETIRTEFVRIREASRFTEAGQLRVLAAASGQAPDAFIRAHREKVAASKKLDVTERPARAVSAAASTPASGVAATAR